MRLKYRRQQVYTKREFRDYDHSDLCKSGIDFVRRSRDRVHGYKCLWKFKCRGELYFENNVPGTITQILAAVASANGFTNSVSATYDTTSSVPEPMTLSMMGFGLLGIGLLRRRKAS